MERIKYLSEEYNKVRSELMDSVSEKVDFLLRDVSAGDYLYSKEINHIYFLLGCDILDVEGLYSKLLEIELSVSEREH